MRILNLKTIQEYLDIPKTIQDIEHGFVCLSQGKATVPPVGHLGFPKGDCHIKYGYIDGDDYFVIKVASGFYDNVKVGLRNSSGLMLICSARTGYPIALLEDEGHLTDIRTAMAGLIAAKYLAPKKIRGIGIVGTGIQAKLQLEYLKHITQCRKAFVWNHRSDSITDFVRTMTTHGFDITVCDDLEKLAGHVNLIVTTTPSTQALIQYPWINKGTHITAMGADSPGKQELDLVLIQRADVCVVDSKSQCLDHGEIQTAFEQGLIQETDLAELGEVIHDPSKGRTNDEQITIADLTGVAVQDIKIACSVYEAWAQANSS